MLPHTILGGYRSTTEKKRVFLSFAAEDKAQVQGLRLLKDNPNFDLDFYDESVQVAVDSSDVGYIKRVIREKIRRCSVTICLIGVTTYKSQWVEWELTTSKEESNKIVVMALKGIDRAVLPSFVKENSLAFHAWDTTQLATLV